MRSKTFFPVTWGLLIVSAALAFTALFAVQPAYAASQGAGVAEQLQEEFAAVAATVKPTVVYIDVARPVDMPQGYQYWEWDGQDIPIPPDLREFFNFRFGPQQAPRRGAPQQPDSGEQPKMHGMGSGVIIEASDGYILTNNHVVDKATEIGVTLYDGKRYEAKLVGADPKTDLAIVQIQAAGLTAIEWGDSDALEVGYWVLAFGQPDGLKYTVTKGIISATGRTNLGIIQDSMGYEDFIQTDAAVNPGNSGGPLTNIRAELIGINTAIATHGLPQFGGISFAIPSNLARKISGKLIQHGEVVRGYLGVAINDLANSARFPDKKDRDIAAKYPSGAEGAYVADVVKSGPAEKAGVRPGDVIVKLGGKDIQDSKALRFLVADMEVGAKLPIRVLRIDDGKPKPVDLDIEIGRQPAEFARAGDEGVASTELGLTVQTLTPDVAQDLGLPEDEKGVVVTDVKPGSRADKAGFMPDDVITQIKYKGEATAVESAGELADAVSRIGGSPFSVLRKRDGQAKYVRIE